MNLEFPQTFGAESERAQVKRLADYMYSLTEQLNYVLNHLDTDNFSAETAQALRTAETQARQAVAEAGAHGAAAEEAGGSAGAGNRGFGRAGAARGGGQAGGGAGGIAQHRFGAVCRENRDGRPGAHLALGAEQTAEHLTLRFDEANAYTLEVDGKLAQLTGQCKPISALARKASSWASWAAPLLRCWAIRSFPSCRAAWKLPIQQP